MFFLEEENISTKAVMASGSYAGDGQASKFINLSFNPKAVLVVQRGFDFDGNGYEYHAGLAVTDFFAGSESSKKLVSIDGQGFTVYHYDDGNSTNIGYRTYNYVAFT